jgi:hypothetical protein
MWGHRQGNVKVHGVVQFFQMTHLVDVRQMTAIPGQQIIQPILRCQGHMNRVRHRMPGYEQTNPVNLCNPQRLRCDRQERYACDQRQAIRLVKVIPGFKFLQHNRRDEALVIASFTIPPFAGAGDVLCQLRAFIAILRRDRRLDLNGRLHCIFIVATGAGGRILSQRQVPRARMTKEKPDSRPS